VLASRQLSFWRNAYLARNHPCRYLLERRSSNFES
jgi:hypothetical protein